VIRLKKLKLKIKIKINETSKLTRQKFQKNETQIHEPLIAVALLYV
jgi:hypothetical protein